MLRQWEKVFVVRSLWSQTLPPLLLARTGLVFASWLLGQPVRECKRDTRTQGRSAAGASKVEVRVNHSHINPRGFPNDSSCCILSYQLADKNTHPPHCTRSPKKKVNVAVCHNRKHPTETEWLRGVKCLFLEHLTSCLCAFFFLELFKPRLRG